MVTDAQLLKPAARARARALDFELDRSSAFRRARRHTLVVRTLRIALPVIAVLLFASYGLFVGRSYEISIGDGRLTIGPVSLSTETVTAENPHYEGFNKDGGKFIVKAKSAEHDFRQTGPIGLKGIDGTLTEQDSTVTRLRAPRGSFDNKASVLELLDRIDVDSNNGLKALLTRATVFTKENRIVSSEPVTVEMPTGVVRGNELLLLPKTRRAVFSKGVAARLKQEPRTEQPGGTASATRLFGASDAPVDVTSATLEVDDLATVAVFTGNVRATQGEAVLTAPELEVSYEGRTGAQGPGAPTDASSRLKRITAKSDVVITQGEDRATSRSAEFDAKANTALLTGNVVVTQLKNVLKGQRLFVDRNTATSQLTSPADGGDPKGRITARLYQSEANNAPQKNAAPKAKQAPQGDALGMPLRTDPTLPIDIEAERLDVDDNAKLAVFRGNVVAVQGDYTIRTAELAATYTGQAGIGLGAAAPEGGVTSAARLQKVQARKKAVVTSKDGQSGSGDWADFDIKANIVTLVGNVVLTQGGNTVTGPKAIMNLNSGKSHIVYDTADALGRNPEKGPAAPPAAGSGGRRPSLLLYPNQMKEKEKEKAKQKGNDGDAGRDGKDGKASARNPADGAAARTSGWNTNTMPGFANDGIDR